MSGFVAEREGVVPTVTAAQAEGSMNTFPASSLTG